MVFLSLYEGRRGKRKSKLSLSFLACILKIYVFLLVIACFGVQLMINHESQGKKIVIQPESDRTRVNYKFCLVTSD